MSSVSNISNGYINTCSYMDSVEEGIIYIATYKNLYSSDQIMDVLMENMQGYKMKKLYEGDFSATYAIERSK